MRFREISIPAFASFTDFECKFTAPSHDLHIIYGANEAGKSSMLRAITDLLFGIPMRSSDNFQHDYKDLLIGAEIQNQAGNILAFQRNKSRASLQNHHGDAIPEDTLKPFIGNMDREYFSAAFGLGAAELAKGADQLLKGEGNIGRALFSASTGGSRLIEVMESLQTEAHTIYKPRATTSVTLAPARKKYDAIKAGIQTSAVKPDRWRSLRLDIENLEKKLSADKAELDSIDRQRKEATRYDSAAPIVARINAFEHQINSLPDYPVTSGETIATLREANKNSVTNKEQIEQLQARKESLEHSLSSYVISKEVLASDVLIENLYSELGAYQQRCTAQLQQENELATLESTIRSEMRALNLPGNPTSLTEHAVDIANQLKYTEATNTLHQQNKQFESLQTDIDQLRSQIASSEALTANKQLPDTQPLKLALSLANRVRTAYTNLPEQTQQVEQLQQQLAQQHALLRGAPTDYAKTAALEVPGKAAIGQYRDSMRTTNQQSKHESDNLTGERQELERVQEQLSRLQQQGELPTISDLEDARRHRDYGWALVLNDWKGKTRQRELYSPLPLEIAFPDAIQKADQIADRLRLDADQVAQAEEKKQLQSRLQSRIKSRKAALDSLQQQATALTNKWGSAWSQSGVIPDSPDEMLEWYDNWDSFRQLHLELQKENSKLHSVKTGIAQAVEALSQSVPDAAITDFNLLTELAEQRLRSLQEQSWNHSQLQQDIATSKRSLEQLEQRLPAISALVNSAQKHWQSCCESMSLPADLSAESADELLHRRSALLGKHEALITLNAAFTDNQKLNDHYRDSVQGLLQQLSIAAPDTIDGVTAMWSALTRNRKESVQYDNLQAQLESVNAEIASTQVKSQQIHRTRQHGLQQLGLSDHQTLDTALDQLTQRNELLSQLQTLQISLNSLAANDDLGEFKERVERESDKDLPASIRQLDNEFKEKNEDLNNTAARLKELQNELRTLEEAGDEVAGMEQELQAVAADIESDARRYIRLRLAAQFIGAQVENFRRDNQGPMLELTSNYLRQLTLGSITAVSPDFGIHNKPVLVGLRNDGRHVGVKGMSDGTRDQLYLALRLAALDLFLTEQEAMPLILDDLLITFDDARSAALLELLANFSSRTQIFLFTHHQHIIELCQRVLQPGQYSVHQLQTSA